MLEYHRLRASKSMVFWRFSLRKFTRFYPGDLVFFIDSDSRYPATKEKGLIGYGRCSEIRNKTPKTTWDDHGSQTGYASYHDFTEAIRYYRKNDHRLPQTLQVIKLDNVHFFQSPIFLSEIGIEMSPRLESFLYIEQDKKDQSVKLLEIAKEIGIDQWTLSQNKKITDVSLEDDLNEQKIRNVLSTLDVSYSEQQLRLIKNHTERVVINKVFYSYNKGELKIFYPLARLTQLNPMIGFKTICETVLKTPFDFVMITDLKLNDETNQLLDLLNVKRA